MRLHSYWLATCIILPPCTSMKFRDQASTFLRVTIGDGRMAAFWYDHWLPIGRLIDIIGDSGPTILGIPLTARISDAVFNGSWKIRRSWARRFPELADQLQATQVPSASNGPDIYEWQHGLDNYRNTFSAKGTWEHIRDKRPNQPWTKIVWLPQSIPRCGFITWLTIKDRLSTGNRMRRWGHHQPCIFVWGTGRNMRSSFFACPYTFTVWSSIAGNLLGARISPDWTSTITSLQHPPGTRSHGILLRLAFQVSIYSLWRERNIRIHSHIYTSIAIITRQIDKMVRNRISSLHYPSNSRRSDLMQIWFASHG